MSKKPVNVWPSGMGDGIYFAGSSSSEKVYEVRTLTPYSCTCIAFAITRNRAVNKQPGLKVTCKHIEGAIAQYGLPMEPLSNEAYAAMIAELQQIREQTA